jgi:hypothetical protein
VYTKASGVVEHLAWGSTAKRKTVNLRPTLVRSLRTFVATATCEAPVECATATSEGLVECAIATYGSGGAVDGVATSIAKPTWGLGIRRSPRLHRSRDNK